MEIQKSHMLASNIITVSINRSEYMGNLKYITRAAFIKSCHLYFTSVIYSAKKS